MNRESQKNGDDDDADDDLDNVDDDGEPDVTCARVSLCEEREREQEKLRGTSSLNLGLE